MNVLISVPWDNLGGVCNVVNTIAQHMRDQGHGVWLLLPGESDQPERLTSRIGLPAFRLNLRPPRVRSAPIRSRLAYQLFRPRSQRVLRQLITDHAIDIVNVHYPIDASIHFALARRAGVARLVTSIHGADLLPYNTDTSQGQQSVSGLLNASDIVVSPSKSFAKAASEAWPALAHHQVAVVPNGVDPVELGYHPAAPWREADPAYLLSVSTLVAYKGIDVLIRAFALIAGQFPTLRLKLVSGGPDFASLTELARGLGLAERVDFVGPVDRARVASYLSGCTLFVMPSRSNSESFGIAAAEAMALDRTVIASAIGALPEMVHHGSTGLLVPPGDAAALADAMRTALHDRHLRERLGRAAGERTRREYLWSRTGAEYEALFTRVMASVPILSAAPPASPASPAHQT